MSNRRVAYYYDTDVGAYTYGLGHPMKPHRIRVTHDLVTAYGMLDKMHVLKPTRASPEVMTSFHTDEYVHFLQNVTPELAEKLTFHGTRFLVGEDNPAFEGVFEFCSISAGGSIGAARQITSGAADIAINWAGGLHHAKKREASGFCYINDIVLGTLELLRTYPRVLYIDIDCHHGDGVEEAFYTTDRVMTCSFHKFGEYFPGTGTQEDKGRGRGRGYALNVPLKDGITDESYRSVFEPVITRVLEVFRPSAVVLQCGSDSLAGDKLGCFNLSMRGHANCVQFMRRQNIPLILLGGGGYTVKNVARTWTFETACALNIEDEIDDVMPWNQYFEWFGPRYRLEVPENNMEDLNVKDGSLHAVREKALEQLRQLTIAPSVQLQDVPREDLGHHLGFGHDAERQGARDTLDEELAQTARSVFDLQAAAAPPSASSASSSSDSDDSDIDSDLDSDRVASGSGWPSAPRHGLRTPPPPPLHTSHPYMQHVNHSSRRDRRHRTQKQRISLLTGEYYDVPIAQPHEPSLGIVSGVPAAVGLGLGLGLGTGLGMSINGVVEEFDSASGLGIGAGHAHPAGLGYAHGYAHYACGALPAQRGAHTKRRFFGLPDEELGLAPPDQDDDNEEDSDGREDAGDDAEDGGEDVDVEAPGSGGVEMSLDMDVVPGRRNRPQGARASVARAMERGGGAGHSGRKRAKRGRRGPSATASAENSEDMESSDVEMS